MTNSDDLEAILDKTKQDYIKKKMIQLGWLFRGDTTADDYVRFSRAADAKFDLTYVLQCTQERITCP